MMSDKIVILRGSDGHQTISVRLHEETLDKIDDLAAESNRSRNHVINMLLDKAVEMAEVEE